MTARLKKMGSEAALTAWREQLRAAAGLRQELRVCVGGSCLAAGAQKVREALQQAAVQAGVGEEVVVGQAGCMGPCVRGPVVRMADGTFYQGVQPDDATDIVREHVQAGRVVERLCASDAQTQRLQPKAADIPFFTRQTPVVLRNCGWIDPERIEEYVARDGYAALAKALTVLSPERVIEEMKSSGLRGRGGGGFPTYLKWEFTRRAPGPVKHVLCNADEGDPGAYMDRSVLEGDPHSVIEGMAIAAFTVGAAQGCVYVRAEYPLAVARLRLAMEQARACGLLGT